MSNERFDYISKHGTELKEEYISRMKCRAEKHTAEMQERFGNSIDLAASSSKKYTNSDISNIIIRYENTETCVDSICVEDFLEFANSEREKFGKIAVLNFASYKHPGGGFIRGMMAQEEVLCHISGLYNVLSKRKDFYELHPNSLNKGLYSNHALYSPNVPFVTREMGDLYFCDVITCAAPNLSPILRYKTLGDKECYEAMDSRIEFIFNVAAQNKVDTLVFGAFGCGVFKNNPYIVSALVRYYAERYKGCFKYIIHSIPTDKSDVNFKVFMNTLTKEDIINIDTHSMCEMLKCSNGKSVVVFHNRIEYNNFRSKYPDIADNFVVLENLTDKEYRFVKLSNGEDTTGIMCLIGCWCKPVMIDNCEKVFYYNSKHNNKLNNKGNYVTVTNGITYYVN